MVRCTVCEEIFGQGNFSQFASHFIIKANTSDPQHIAWLNKNISKKKIDIQELTQRISNLFDLNGKPLRFWLIKQFINLFYETPAHPFVEALQHPSRSTLLGYVFEHQHFLRQWVRSLSFIIGKTEHVDVTLFELDNIITEFGGGPEQNQTAHYNLLLEMGESLGIKKQKILDTPPLPATKDSLEKWQYIAENYHWLETMVAMHGLELIAHRDLRSHGASKHYFDPDILESDAITSETKLFLLEGYEADEKHSTDAFKIIEKYTNELGIIEAVQSTFLKSIDAFDKYLLSRLQRAKDFES